MIAMEFHEVAELLPMMAEAELHELAVDIKQHGQREPITTWQGKIIDGRNRYRACAQAGVDPVFTDWSGKGSLIAFVVSENVKRRHLSSTQRAVIGVGALELYEKDAQERKRQHGGTAPGRKTSSGVEVLRNPKTLGQKVDSVSKGKATGQAAKAAGTNRQYISDVKAIMQVAPELIPFMRDDRMNVAEGKLIARLPTPDVAVIVKEMSEGATLDQAARKLGKGMPLPTPAQARKLAIAKGQPVLANNDHWIPPVTQEVQAATEAEMVLFGDFADAVRLIAGFTSLFPEVWVAIKEWHERDFDAALDTAIEYLVGLRTFQKETTH